MSAPGVFGKLPARGDFISRGLNADFADTWHDWLVRGMAAARETLGERFEASYASCPVWRFALPAGAAGASRAVGVMLPSADSAGRRFPLTLAETGDDMPSLSALLTAETWFDALEAHGWAGAQGDQDFEEWLAGLEKIALGLQTVEYHFRGASAARNVLADRAGGDMSVFWRNGEAERDPACLVVEGQPDEAVFVRLIWEDER